MTCLELIFMLFLQKLIVLSNFYIFVSKWKTREPFLGYNL